MIYARGACGVTGERHRLLAFHRQFHPRGRRPGRGEEFECEATLRHRRLCRQDHLDHPGLHVVAHVLVKVLELDVARRVVKRVGGGREVARVDGDAAHGVAEATLLRRREVQVDHALLVFRRQLLPVDRRRLSERAAKAGKLLLRCATVDGDGGGRLACYAWQSTVRETSLARASGDCGAGGWCTPAIGAIVSGGISLRSVSEPSGQRAVRVHSTVVAAVAVASSASRSDWTAMSGGARDCIGSARRFLLMRDTCPYACSDAPYFPHALTRALHARHAHTPNAHSPRCFSTIQCDDLTPIPSPVTLHISGRTLRRHDAATDTQPNQAHHDREGWKASLDHTTMLRISVSKGMS